MHHHHDNEAVERKAAHMLELLLSKTGCKRKSKEQLTLTLTLVLYTTTLVHVFEMQKKVIGTTYYTTLATCAHYSTTLQLVQTELSTATCVHNYLTLCIVNTLLHNTTTGEH